MCHVPSKRLLVYVAIGVVVVIVGTWGVMSLRGDGNTGVEIDFGGARTSTGVQTPSNLAGVTGTSSSASVPGGSSASVGSNDPGQSSLSSSTTSTVLIWVQVAGEVRRPGVYQMDPEARVFQAVAAAGGVTEKADEEALPLAARLWDGCRLVVPTKNEPHGPVLSGDGATGTSLGTGSATTTQAPAQKVSLNSGTVEQLDSLPGVGMATAQQIVAYREANGPFTSVDQLTEVPGIGPAKLEKLRPLVEL